MKLECIGYKFCSDIYFKGSIREEKKANAIFFSGLFIGAKEKNNYH